MPNWCSNVVVLSHKDRSMLEKVQAGLKGDGMMSAFLPVPAELANADAPNRSDNTDALVEKYGAADWYTWCVRNWGTKWDVTSNSVQFIGDDLEFYFDSAWAPPIQFYEHLQELGFLVDAKYYEPGMCFAGTYYDGIDECYEYSNMSSDEIQAELPKELDEFFCISESVAEFEEYEQEDEE